VLSPSELNGMLSEPLAEVKSGLSLRPKFSLLYVSLNLRPNLTSCQRFGLRLDLSPEFKLSERLSL